MVLIQKLGGIILLSGIFMSLAEQTATPISASSSEDMKNQTSVFIAV